MPNKFPRGHNEIKALIAQCAEFGVGIDALPEYGGRFPRFRFMPVAEPPLHNGRPSGRGLVSAGARNPHGVKNWSPSKLSLNPMYGCPMIGDDWDLHKAKAEWAKGDPSLLRNWLAARPRPMPEPVHVPELPLAA